MMNNQIIPKRQFPPSPIHPLAALSTILLDGVFGAFEFLDPFAIVITSISVGTLGMVSTMLVQRYLAKEEWGPAAAKGLVMGIIAGVPFPVAGTAVGVPLLAWAGLHEWVKLPGSKNSDSGSDITYPDQNIVDGEVKDVTDENEKSDY
jgi:hypothetical protein